MARRSGEIKDFAVFSARWRVTRTRLRDTSFRSSAGNKPALPAVGRLFPASDVEHLRREAHGASKAYRGPPDRRGLVRLRLCHARYRYDGLVQFVGQFIERVGSDEIRRGGTRAARARRRNACGESAANTDTSAATTVERVPTGSLFARASAETGPALPQTPAVKPIAVASIDETVKPVVPPPAAAEKVTTEPRGRAYLFRGMAGLIYSTRHGQPGSADQPRRRHRERSYLSDVARRRRRRDPRLPPRSRTDHHHRPFDGRRFRLGVCRDAQRRGHSGEPAGHLRSDTDRRRRAAQRRALHQCLQVHQFHGRRRRRARPPLPRPLRELQPQGSQRDHPHQYREGRAHPGAIGRQDRAACRDAGRRRRRGGAVAHSRFRPERRSNCGTAACRCRRMPAIHCKTFATTYHVPLWALAEVNRCRSTGR